MLDLIGKIVANGFGQHLQVLAIHDELTLIKHPEWGAYVVATFHVARFEVVGQISEEERKALLPDWYIKAINTSAAQPQISIVS
jgi:hypothetical protein